LVHNAAAYSKKCASTTLQLLGLHYQPQAKETKICHDVHKKFEHVAELKMKLVADYEENYLLSVIWSVVIFTNALSVG
jgi:hypothetical protein